ncbi:ABC transporter substrate-binding protein [bacterium]|nr:ABC transporter substrate-binding protein [bacterium]
MRDQPARYNDGHLSKEDVPLHWRWVAILLLTAIAGCGGPRSGELVVYCAVDREFSQPVLDAFSKKTGIIVQAKFDTESTKSVALAEQILRERQRPRCDVFWNNEILHTIRLERAGLFRATYPSEMDHYPVETRSRENLWHGVGARARVLLVNTNRVTAEETPRQLDDLADDRWKGEIGLAKPFFGTTATQMAALAAVMEQDQLADWLDRLRANEVRILSGNKQVAIEVGSGALAMGLTDTDDALAELTAHRPVRIVYLDAAVDQRGILLLPNTVAAMVGSANSAEADAFVNFLVSQEGESLLNNARCGQIPLHDTLTPAWEPSPPAGGKLMVVDFARAADLWESVQHLVRSRLVGP